MRTRVENELAARTPGRLNIKTGRGGIVDIEFLVQMLQLRYGARHPSVRVRGTAEAIAALRDAGVCSAADRRSAAARLPSSCAASRRACVSSAIVPVEELGTDPAMLWRRSRVRLGLRRASDPGPSLLADYDRTREEVRALYERLLSASVDRVDLGATADTNPAVEKGKSIWMDGTLVPLGRGQGSRPDPHASLRRRRLRGHPLLRCVDGRSAIFRLREHIVRLGSRARILGIESPYGVDELVEACLDDRPRERAARPATSGRSSTWATARWDSVRRSVNPIHVSIAVWPWGSYLGDEGLANGIRVRTSSFQRMHVNTLMTKAKAVGHYVNSILASMEARARRLRRIADARRRRLRGGGLRREPLHRARRPREDAADRDGARRHHARVGHRAAARATASTVVEERFTRDEIYIADEAFLTGTAAEITPMRSLDDRVIGHGKAGAGHASVCRPPTSQAIRGERAESPVAG